MSPCGYGLINLCRPETEPGKIWSADVTTGRIMLDSLYAEKESRKRESVYNYGKLINPDTVFDCSDNRQLYESSVKNLVGEVMTVLVLNPGN